MKMSEIYTEKLDEVAEGYIEDISLAFNSLTDEEMLESFRGTIDGLKKGKSGAEISEELDLYEKTLQGRIDKWDQIGCIAKDPRGKGTRYGVSERAEEIHDIFESYREQFANPLEVFKLGSDPGRLRFFLSLEGSKSYHENISELDVSKKKAQSTGKKIKELDLAFKDSENIYSRDGEYLYQEEGCKLIQMINNLSQAFETYEAAQPVRKISVEETSETEGGGRKRNKADPEKMEELSDIAEQYFG